MQWFKHDTDATQDAKIKKLILRYGPLGYAIYFHCIELIASDISESNLTFELEHDSEIIADNLKVKGTIDQSAVNLTEEVMRYIVELGLYENTDGRITCMKILKRLDTSMIGNPRFRALIASAKPHKQENHDSIMTDHDSIMTHHDSVMLEENRIDEKRKEEKKEEPDFSSSFQKIETQDEDDPFAPSPIHRLESALATWNSDSTLPRYRFLPVAMPEQARGAALRTLGAYTDAEVKTAIGNYSKILQNPSAWEAFPKYTGFQGFMASGVEQYADEARPFERCKVKAKPGEYIDPDRDEKMRKAAERAKDFIREDDEEEVRVDMTAIMNSLTNRKRVTV